MRVPVALDDELDRLLAAAEQAGERTNRKELGTSLIATCDLDGDELGSALRRYRTMTVRQVLPDVPHGAKVVRLADHPPGPRSARR